MTSGLEDMINVLDWEQRMGRFRKKEETNAGLYLIAFLMGTLFGMVLVELILPFLVNNSMQVFP